MPRKRSRLTGWTYDDQRQELTTPAGRVISLHEIAERIHDDICCRHDFKGAWSGWRMRGDKLYPPRTSGRWLNPNTGPHLAAWISEAADQQHARRNSPAGHPRLFLAYTRDP
jgi:hypothetical protein